MDTLLDPSLQPVLLIVAVALAAVVIVAVLLAAADALRNPGRWGTY
jgi:hypothetical protein